MHATFVTLRLLVHRQKLQRKSKRGNEAISWLEKHSKLIRMNHDQLIRSSCA